MATAAYTVRAHHGPRGPGAGAAAPRHVHRRHRHRGYHHLLWEIVDNSVDEVINGYATHIEVTLHKDGKSVTVVDDGRGIPVDVKTEFKKSALELVLTTLHAGGKFSSAQYQFSGGLHGVGSSVVNALSEELVATIKRDGAEWEQTYARGKPASKLPRCGAAQGHRHVDHLPSRSARSSASSSSTPRRSATASTPRPTCTGLKIIFRDEAAGTERGVRARGRHRRLPGAASSPIAARRRRRRRCSTCERDGEGGVRLEAALQWTESHDETIRSYVNGIPTTQGGTHEQGFRAAIVKAVQTSSRRPIWRPRA